MSKPFEFEIQGLGKLTKRIADLPAKLQKEVGGEILASAQSIHRQQLRSVPVDTGRLKQGMPEPTLNKLQTELTSNALYSAYVEFGTGSLVSIPEGFGDYAAQFKGKGIRQVNLPARPFFFPPFILEKPKLIKNLQVILSDL